jgi:opacity protein-like surface antigen
MKTIIAFAALAAAVVSPVLAQAAAQPRHDVTIGNQNVGADPDANVRFDLEREAGTRNGSF